MAALHYARAELTIRSVGACGTLGVKTTAAAEEVTCKRCLKTIETGSAATGRLAGRVAARQPVDFGR